jgi:hypothetical protein
MEIWFRIVCNSFLILSIYGIRHSMVLPQGFGLVTHVLYILDTAWTGKKENSRDFK